MSEEAVAPKDFISSSTKLCAINPNPNWRSSLQRPLSPFLSISEFAACCKFLLLVSVVVAITFVLIGLHNWVSEKAVAREDFSSFVQRSSAPQFLILTLSEALLLNALSLSHTQFGTCCEILLLQRRYLPGLENWYCCSLLFLGHSETLVSFFLLSSFA
jgi:hypothetical protein